MDKQISIFALAVFTGVLMFLTPGCQKHPESAAFRFLFPEEEISAEKPKPLEAQTPASTVVQTADAGVLERPLVSHKPYIGRKCAACHEGASAFSTPIFGNSWDGIFRSGGGKPGPLVAPAQKLCQTCHKDLSPEWAIQRGLYLQKLSAEGKCLACHAAHQSRYPFRLNDDPDRLCVSCHNEGNKIGAAKCIKDADQPKPCLSCHNVHLGKDRFMLKKDYMEEKHTAFLKPDPSGENLSPVDCKKTE